MKKRGIKISAALAFLLGAYFILENKVFKNVPCLSENGRYEVWDTLPIDITEEIEKDNCECIGADLIINYHPLPFSHAQLTEVKVAIPAWADSSLQELSDEDRSNLATKLEHLSDFELLDKLTYRYSFFPREGFGEVFVYTMRVSSGFTSATAYLLNYQELYDAYDNMDPQDRAMIFGEKPNHPIVEDEAWIRREFGETGVINWKWYTNISRQIFR